MKKKKRTTYSKVVDAVIALMNVPLEDLRGQTEGRCLRKSKWPVRIEHKLDGT